MKNILSTYRNFFLTIFKHCSIIACLLTLVLWSTASSAATIKIGEINPLSGRFAKQKRMLTVARGLLSGARLLLLDDPFLGLAPKEVDRLCDTLKQIRRHGITLFLAGQHVRRILKVACKAYLLEEGKITLSGTGDHLLGHPHLRESLFGVVAESGVEVL